MRDFFWEFLFLYQNCISLPGNVDSVRDLGVFVCRICVSSPLFGSETVVFRVEIVYSSGKYVCFLGMKGDLGHRYGIWSIYLH